MWTDVQFCRWRPSWVSDYQTSDMKPPGITLGGFYFPVLKRWKNGRALSEFGHSGQACNGFGRTMHVGGFGGRNAPIPGGVWGLVRQGNPWRGAGGYWRRRDCLARTARGHEGWHPVDGQSGYNGPTS